MSERAAVTKRILVAIPYLPLYYFVIYPFTFFTGLGLAAVGALYTYATGERMGSKPKLTSRIWSWGSDNVEWVLTGKGDFEVLP